MIRVSRSIVPNVFTVGNMFCGFMSVIICTITGDIVLASWMIIFAAFLDALDGKVARMTKSSSAFGVEYDSLADVVSFGLAPSVLIYAYYFSQWRSVGVFISFFPLLFGSLRLARFNVQLTGFDKTHFTGLPIPVAAGALASYILFMDEFFPGVMLSKVVLMLTIIVSVLMVSRIRYEIFPSLSMVGGKRQKVKVILIIFLLIALLIYPKKLFFPYILLYILIGFTRSVVRWLGSDDQVPVTGADVQREP